jgi:hypothetical protein
MKKVSDIARDLVPAYESCGNCVDGWVRKDTKWGYDGVVRCWCWKAHQQKLAEALQQQGKKA